MKEFENDKLGSLFQEINSSQPSSGFESRLMQQIKLVAAKQAKRHKKILLATMIGGIAAMTLLPLLAFYIFGLSTTAPQLDFDKFELGLSELSFAPSLISIACVILLLLLIDMFVRNKIWSRKHKH